MLVAGSGFVAGNTSVTIGGTSATAVTVISSTLLMFTTPAEGPGNVPVTVTTGGGTSSAVPGGFTFDVPPTILSVNPASGPIFGGTSVVVTGMGFVPVGISVTVDGIPAAVAEISSGELIFATAPHAAGNVPVIVTTPGGSVIVPGGFTFEGVPTATSISPASGLTTGGIVVTVSGTGFVAGATSVTIGTTTIPVGAVIVASSTSLSFVTPAEAVGNVAVSVSTAGGTSTVPGGFTYQAAFTIGGTVSGLTAGDEIVVTNFPGSGIAVINNNGSFTLSGFVPANSTYTVLVLTQPPNQNCVVTHNMGTVGATNITNVLVTCTPTYTISGTLSGLNNGGELVMQNSDDGGDVILTNNGSFTFSFPLSDDTVYNINVIDQPAGQACTILNGNGLINGANVTNVTVTCTSN
jgi:hypothetical protein